MSIDLISRPAALKAGQGGYYTEPGLALAGLVVLLLGAPLFELGRRATGARPLASRPPC